jgi:hypothetical protein
MTGLESKPNPAPSRSTLDGPAARLVALGVFLLAAGAIGWFHRDDIFPPDAVANSPAELCIAERWAGIDEMAADGTIDAARAKLFKSRAEALCWSQAGKN